MTLSKYENKRIEVLLKEYIGPSTVLYNDKELKVALFSAEVNKAERIIKIIYEENFIAFFKKKPYAYKIELLQLYENLYDF